MPNPQKTTFASYATKTLETNTLLKPLILKTENHQIKPNKTQLFNPQFLRLTSFVHPFPRVHNLVMRVPRINRCRGPTSCLIPLSENTKNQKSKT